MTWTACHAENLESEIKLPAAESRFQLVGEQQPQKLKGAWWIPVAVSMGVEYQAQRFGQSLRDSRKDW